MRNGMTLMSVMVAVALAGIVALAVARLLGNQSKTMSVVRLREQREELLKHYKNIVISGWDATRDSTQCSAPICARNTDVIIPTANGEALYLAEDLYDYNYTGGTADRWWKVSVIKSFPSSGNILQADNYVKDETLIAVEVKVEFIRKEHPVVNTRLATRQEIVFLHHNTSGALSSNRTRCLGSHLTQQYEGHLSYRGPLYVGKGAIIQYDFTSNYTKCSQVPLVNVKKCPQGALLGFFRNRKTGSFKKQLISGNAICSTSDFADDIAQIRGSSSAQRGTSGTEKRTVQAFNCEGSGYVEWMRDNEIPQCVTGYASGNDTRRVAGESVDAPFATQPFRLAKKTREPTATDCGNYTNTSASAFYTVDTCDVPRYEGIEKFDERGKVETYVKYYDDFSEIGPRGPRGPWGPQGLDDAPPGPPGLQRCNGCRKPCSWRRWECTTDGLGNRTCGCVSRSSSRECMATCPTSSSGC